ncbi:MAG: TlyA family RNA methyltransferase [Caldilinea sp.]|jgi:23S rRNA (cytidine1920-2'-O)/16S rRNA (cytidine1409-2'-O)-methyltransferase|uniref:TlyA family RNA methyltransferase n=1 Tax=Caldilinea sp. TaxID=2293560 RepID=UPI0030A7E349
MNAKEAKKERLDRLMVLRGLAESREQAQRLIMAGEVEVDGKRQDKPGRAVSLDAEITVRRPLPYVSRGGFKLAAALDAFTVPVAGCVAIDVGASTGGFTDCLLQRGAARVYAVDVGYGQLAWKLRTDPRVIVMDRTNVRHLEALPDGALADLAVIDASFISLTLVLPAVLRLLKPNAQIIALVKPQFEAGVDDVGKGGVVRNIEVHRRVLRQISAAAQSLGLHPAGLIASPVLGPAGNVEFLLWLKREPSGSDAFALEQAIANALEEAQQMQKRGQREAP